MTARAGRMVVTGADGGRSHVVSDGPSNAVIVLEALAGSQYEALWEVSVPVASPSDGDAPATGFPYIPDAGRARFMRVVVPPEHEMSGVDLEAALAEAHEKAPSLLAAMDPTRGAGMHRTDSIDFVVVHAGQLVLTLEHGEALLGPGDCVVQRGTWHAWRNPGNEPCVLFTVMLRTTSATTTPA